MAFNRKVDPKLAQDIEDDMAEIDDRRPRRSAVKSQACPDCKDSKLGPGLLDAFTQCPTCKGSGKVAQLKDAE